MAEGFANHYGSDVLRASSAGLAPAVALSPYTRKVMLEKNVDIGNHLPRSLNELDVRGIDLIVNMSGYAIPGMKTMDWVIADPYGGPVAGYRAARDRIEVQVMNLILKMRTGKI
jgi:arsenate reductase